MRSPCRAEEQALPELSINSVLKLTEDEALELFKQLRWLKTNGEPMCPACDSRQCYHSRTRPIYTCKACSQQFSVTSGTLFAHRRLPLKHYLLAVVIFAHSPSGSSCARLGRLLGVQYKTAYVLANKLREMASNSYLFASFDEQPGSSSLTLMADKNISIQKAGTLLQAALTHSQSRNWSGYWQGYQSKETIQISG
ncbi:transposase [Paraneptunicella aestuarii]|uniref:transposase n=1 Tax=Paraneptunicella aestuarii TaxID=2831148 RepID=UPI001E32200C|nr:transposase [Paraneptunicella aestuarii]UAA40290.1 transposase [Paraneptunicella aestuarii]